MKAWVKPGQKIVCIAEADEWGNSHPLWKAMTPNIPVKDGIYTIREAAVSVDDILGVWLVELHNPIVHFPAGPAEPNFDVRGFRPLDERKTSIEVFEKMLGPQLVDA